MSLGAPIRHSGNESLFLAVEMSLVSTLAGIPLHIHAEGLRGTGKTTVMRCARQSMPCITQVSGCAYHCDPKAARCPDHKRGGPWPAEEVPMPFIEVGHGAKLGTVLGSIDLGRLTGKRDSEAALLPGSIPMANRGIVFIDEVNRLAETAPEITDVMLSVMGTKPGLVKIEEVGLPPCEIEVLASVWAASNPDEDPGPLEDVRRQLADRFDLVIPVQRPSDPIIVERLLFRSAETAQPPAFLGLAEKAARLPAVTVPPHIVRYISQLYVHRNVESLRAVEALELTGRLYAAMRGKEEVTFEELQAVLPLVLRHRVEPSALSEILRDLELRKAAGSEAKPPAPPADAGTGSGDQSTAPPGDPDKTGTDTPENCPQEARVERKTSPPTAERPRGPKPSWFEKLVDGYRKASAGKRVVSSAGGNSGVQRLPDPATMKPVSPPDKARRISSIAWPDMVMPPDWKDRSP